jgi:hypothetical protein
MAKKHWVGRKALPVGGNASSPKRLIAERVVMFVPAALLSVMAVSLGTIVFFVVREVSKRVQGDRVAKH